MSGLVRGSAPGEGGFSARKTTVKAEDLGDATPAADPAREELGHHRMPPANERIPLIGFDTQRH
jgi:hypothetical protein